MKKSGRKRKFKSIYLMLLIIVLVIISLFAGGLFLKFWSMGNNTIKIDTNTITANSQNKFSIEFGKKSKLICTAGYIVKDNDGFLEWINDQGTVVQKSQTKLIDPIIKSDGDFLIAAEMNGRNVEVYNKLSLAWKTEIEDNIQNVNVNRNGYAAVVRAYPGFKSAVEVYNQKGKKLYFSCRADNTIVEAFVLPNNITTVLNTLNTNACALESIIEMLQMKSGKVEVIKKFALDNSLVLKLQTLGDSSFILASQNDVTGVNDAGAIIYKKKFKRVQSISAFNNDTSAIAGVEQDKKTNKNVVEFINSKNEPLNALQFDAVIKGMVAGKDVIIVNLGRKVVIMNRHGRILGGATASSDILKVDFISNNKAIAITSDNAIICNY